MIEEAYCSFEVARLLEEKGFNEVVHAYHNIYDKVNLDFNVSVDAPHLQIPCPTHQMAMRWLREVHNIGIFPSTYTHISDRKTIHSYGTAIINLKTYELMTDSYLANDTYEEAVEAALRYCLENLI